VFLLDFVGCWRVSDDNTHVKQLNYEEPVFYKGFDYLFLASDQQLANDIFDSFHMTVI
jgi:hypothetical protein